MPITLSGRPVAAANRVMEIEEVLLAITDCAGNSASSWPKIFSFSSRFSVDA